MHFGGKRVVMKYLYWSLILKEQNKLITNYDKDGIKYNIYIHSTTEGINW